MVCKQCGAELSLEEQSGGTTSGKFREHYECVNCKATGQIKGEASDSPQEWRKTGSAFNEY